MNDFIGFAFDEVCLVRDAFFAEPKISFSPMNIVSPKMHPRERGGYTMNSGEAVPFCSAF